MRVWARLAAAADQPVYLYYFTRVPPGPESERYGAYHAAEIVYAFDTVSLAPDSPNPKRRWTPEARDVELASTMAGYWTSFAKAGDPNATGSPAWPPYHAATDQALELGDEIRVVPALKRERLDLLDSLYEARRAPVVPTTPSGRG